MCGVYRSAIAAKATVRTVSIDEMTGIQALERIAGKETTGLIDWGPDAAIAKIVTTWPRRTHSAPPEALGLKSDASFDSNLRDSVR